MKHVLFGAVAALAILAGASANAAPIASGSEINITGSATFNATTITFGGPGAVISTTGDFSAFGTCASCAVMTSPLTYVPFTPGTVFTADNGSGEIITFTLTSQIDAPFYNGSAVIIHDAAIATMTGFDPTPGEWTFTANQGRVTGSYSSTGLSNGGGGGSVPEPASMLLLGTSLVGLNWARRSGRKIAGR